MKILKRVFVGLLFLFLYAPIIMLIIFSFNESTSFTKWDGFSLKWYGQLFKNRTVMPALMNTLSIAAISAVVSTVIGTISAFGIHHLGKRLKSAILYVNNLPVINPDIVTGVSLLLLFVFFKVNLGYNTLLISHIIFNIPYVILSVLPKLKQLNPNLFEASLDLGANPVKSFFKVILPEIMPGVVSGFLMAITLSIDDFVISYFTAGSTNTLSIIIYTMRGQRQRPVLNALSSLMFISVLVLLVLVNFISSRTDKKEINEKNERRS